MSDRVRHLLRGGAWQALCLSLPLMAMFYLAVVNSHGTFDEDRSILLQNTWHPYLCNAFVLGLAGCYTLWNGIALVASLASGAGVPMLGMLMRIGTTVMLLLWPVALFGVIVAAGIILFSVARPAKTQKTSA